jgi:hypothetical protein
MNLFYSIYLVNNWEYIFRTQMDLLIQSGLYNQCKEIRFYMTGDESNRIALKQIVTGLDKIKYIKDSSDNNYEWPALLDLVNNYTDFNLYFHSKGVTKTSQHVADWRKLMEYFTIECWPKCIKLLQAGIDMVGVNLNIIPHLHYSGNFFWVSGEYLKKFKGQLPGNIQDRLLCEFVICSMQPTISSLHQSNVNHYHQSYPSHFYKT